MKTNSSLRVSVTDGFGLRVDAMTIESDLGITSSPNIDAAVKARCEALAVHLFSTGLTFTMFAHGELQ